MLREQLDVIIEAARLAKPRAELCGVQIHSSKNIGCSVTSGIHEIVRYYMDLCLILKLNLDLVIYTYYQIH